MTSFCQRTYYVYFFLYSIFYTPGSMVQSNHKWWLCLFFSASYFGQLTSLSILRGVWYKFKNSELRGGQLSPTGASHWSFCNSLALGFFLTSLLAWNKTVSLCIFSIGLRMRWNQRNINFCRLNYLEKDEFHILDLDKRSLWIIIGNLDPVKAYSK